MPVEIRTCDCRHWSRPARQNLPLLPMVRTETPMARKKRLLRGSGAIFTLVSIAMLAAIVLKGQSV